MRIFHVLHCQSRKLWVQPKGFDTGIKVYNCIAKEKVPFIIKNKNLVTWYTCGPTVYDKSHVGHASCYIKLDIIQRILRRHFGLNVVTVMNITDIDDKIIQRSIEKKCSPIEIARMYEKEFWRDLDALNVKKANIVVRVTDNISLITNYIQKLIDKRFGYLTEDGSVYFDTIEYQNYGKLVNLAENENEEIHVNSVKKSASDFVLWKAAKPNEIFWDSKFGPGRPGWHIECSTIASTILGSTIDIHAGGVDLKFPHHENEEAQSCAFFDCQQWVNYWLHSGQLLLKDTKMSKSLKNTISIAELLKTTDANTFRMACLLSNYRNNMEFSNEFILGANVVLKSYKFFLNTCNLYIKGDIKAKIDEYILTDALVTCTGTINDALKDDFDTATCIKALNGLINQTNRMLSDKDESRSARSGVSSIIAITNYIIELLEMFGVTLESPAIKTSQDEMINLLVNFRRDVRNSALLKKDKDLLKLCDSVRDVLRECNIHINDHGKVSTWSS